MENKPNASLEIPSNDILDHLEALCQSQFFSSSKRSQEFLRYIVQETIQGRAGQIKERNIACEVFGKDEDFEPGENSVVRVKASDVRKRLVEYYKSAPQQNIRIELPVGSYAPHFLKVEQSSEPPIGTEEAHRPTSRRQFVWLAATAAAALSVSASFPLLRRSVQSPLDRLWKPIFTSNLPLIIFLPVMRYQDNSITEWTGIGPATALGLATAFLTQHQHPYELRFGSELTYAELRDSPCLLLGGFNMDWVALITHNLRYVPRLDQETGERSFFDNWTKQKWMTAIPPDKPYVTLDYGLVCRIFDTDTGQIVFLADGLYTFGTGGAAMLLFVPRLFSELVKTAPAGWKGNAERHSELPRWSRCPCTNRRSTGL